MTNEDKPPRHTAGDGLLEQKPTGTGKSSEDKRLHVVKRDGTRQLVHWDKITARIEGLSKDLQVDPQLVAQKVIVGLVDNISTSNLDEFAAEEASHLTSHHPDYSTLAVRIAVSNLHKETETDYVVVAEKMFKGNPDSKKVNSLYDETCLRFVRRFGDRLNEMLDYDRDFIFQYFGFRTMMKSVVKIGGRPVERPQHVYMRVAIGIMKNWIGKLFFRLDALGDAAPDSAEIKELETLFDLLLCQLQETYDAISTHQYTHASPTMFNAGTPLGQLASCFLLYCPDSIEGIYECLKRCALISKSAGGIGIAFQDVRATDAYINGTGGNSHGIMSFLEGFNSASRTVDQGGAKRPGAFAIYLEPWHLDMLKFLDMKRTSDSKDSIRCRDLFQALWINDLFMERVEQGGVWTLFSPDEAPGLSDTWGEEFDKLYLGYEKDYMDKFCAKNGLADCEELISNVLNDPKYRCNTVNAVYLYHRILQTCIETGGPYLLHKDASNRKSNQQNLGTIKCSNLCVSGDTRILTNKGHQIIRELANKPVSVWNGQEWSVVTVLKTASGANLLEVEFSDGAILHCTPEHKFYLDGAVEPIPTTSLCSGDELRSFDLPLREEMNGESSEDVLCGVDSYQRGWLEAFFLTSARKSTQGNVMVSSRRPEAIDTLRLVLQTFGCRCRFSASYPLDNKSVYTLYISAFQVNKLVALGFPSSILERLPMTSSNIDEICFDGRVRVVAIREGPQNVDTFCFTEHKRHMGIFNGILTGQCSEIVEYSSEDDVAVCNLCSIGLPKCVRDPYTDKASFDYEALRRVTRLITRNLNHVIDSTTYPIKEARNSNLRHRPIGIGVQGLADVFAMMKLPFTSEGAKTVNRLIFETIYFGAMQETIEQARLFGTYESYPGSPLSKGKLQFDLWDHPEPTGLWDWGTVRRDLNLYGARNSLLVAPMPTASTAQVLGNSECLAAGTKVTLADGTTVNIEDIPLDGSILVAGFDQEKKQIVASTAYERLNRGEREVVDLTFSDGRTATCTPDHRFLLTTGEWCTAADLVLYGTGVQCTPFATRVNLPGENPTTSVVLVGRKPAGKALVYDINVAGTHTFLANGLVVHNCFEPRTSNIYVRRTGEITTVVVNQHLVHTLETMNLWTPEMYRAIKDAGGSVQNIPSIPHSIKEVYRTAFEVKMIPQIQMAADRGVFVDQSMSLNWHIPHPTVAQLAACHFEAWRRGLKTAMYYLRQLPAVQAVNVTAATPAVNPDAAKDVVIAFSEAQFETAAAQTEEFVCKFEPGCVGCGG